MTEKRADQLVFGDVGLDLSWRIPDPEALIENSTPPRELAWIAFDGHAVQIGLWPGDPDEEAFEEFHLEAGTIVTLSPDTPP